MSSRSGSSEGDLDHWEVVSKGGSDEPTDEDSDSDSSIEVVTMDSDTECDLDLPSSPSIGVSQMSPVFILRVPSTEVDIDDLTTESEESDEGDVIKDLRVVCHRSGEVTTRQDGGEELTDSKLISSEVLSDSSNSATSLSSETEPSEDAQTDTSVDGDILSLGTDVNTSIEDTILADTDNTKEMENMGREPVALDTIAITTEPVYITPSTPEDNITKDGQQPGRSTPPDSEEETCLMFLEGVEIIDEFEADEVRSELSQLQLVDGLLDTTEPALDNGNLLEGVNVTKVDNSHGGVTTTGSQTEMADVEIILRTLGNFKYIAVLIVISFLVGYLFGTGSSWSSPRHQTKRLQTVEMEAKLQACDSHTGYLQQAINWFSDGATFDLNQVQAAYAQNDRKFTAGYEDKYYIFTFGKYKNEKSKELVHREDNTEVIARLQEHNHKLMQEVNQLNLEKGDLIRQIGLIRYGSPPGTVTHGNQADDTITHGNQADDTIIHGNQADVTLDDDEEDVAVTIDIEDEDGTVSDAGEQNFHWFTPANEDETSQGQPEVKHGSSDVTDSEESEIIREKNEVITAMERDIEIEKGRGDLWQKLYLQLKEEKVVPDEMDLLGHVSHLLQNLSVPEDLSETLKDQWEVVKNQSLEGWQFVMDMAAMMNPAMATPTSQEDPVSATSPKSTETSDREKEQENMNSDSRWHSSSERHATGGVPQWAETLGDVYNKTKSSMSDVSQQIKDTWEQVKNLSSDLWSEHEPSVIKMKEKMSENVQKMSAKMSENVQKMSEKMSEKVHKVSEKIGGWLRKRKWNRTIHNENLFRKPQEEDDEKLPKMASTKRRRFTGNDEGYWSEGKGKEDNDNDVDNDDEKYFKSVWRKCDKKYCKLKHKMDRLDLKRFRRMDFGHMRKCYDIFERFQRNVDMSCLRPSDKMWVVCQQEWWKSVSSGIATVDVNPACRDVLPCWQVRLTTGDINACHGSHSDERHDHCRRKTHNRNGHKGHVHHDHRQHSGCHGRNCRRHKEDRNGRPSHHRDNHWRDGKYQRTKNNPESFHEENNDTIHPDKSESSKPFCDPASEDCPSRESSWYFQQMEQREVSRGMWEESESSEESDWMFSRAEDREFQRTLPDDWYSRRLDTNQYVHDEP